MNEKIIAYLDKTIIKITGLQIKGLKPNVLEELVAKHIGRPVRVIGVTSETLQLDVYGLEPEAIMRDEQGIIKAISLVEGLTASDITQIDRAEKAAAVAVEELAKSIEASCPKERWLHLK
jgi:hypothetical protein